MSGLPTVALAEVAVRLVVALGMLVLLPLGLRLVRAPGLAPLTRLWPAPALAGAVSLWLPRGVPATLLAAPYLLATLALVAVAAARLLRERSLRAGDVAVLTALVTPSVGALALVAERAGVELLGFDLPVLALTVPHLHYAGAVAALVAALVHRAADGSGLARLGAWSVPAGTGVVLLGYFVDDWLELVGAVVLSVGMWSVAALLLARVVPSVTAADGAWVRPALWVAAVVLPLTMLLALSWALGEATGLPHLPVRWMVLTHGVGNALGFGLCATVAWYRLAREEELL